MLHSVMPDALQFGGLLLRPVYTNREVNYEITDADAYVCRIVPRLYGFELSPLDRALVNDRILPLLPRITAFILQQDA